MGCFSSMPAPLVQYCRSLFTEVGTASSLSNKAAVSLPLGCSQVQCCKYCSGPDSGSLQSQAAPGLQLFHPRPQSFALRQAAHTRAYLLPWGPFVLVNSPVEADTVLDACTLDLPGVPILEPYVWHLRLKALWRQTLQWR